jgi:hypothetical protein
MRVAVRPDNQNNFKRVDAVLNNRDCARRAARRKRERDIAQRERWTFSPPNGNHGVESKLKIHLHLSDKSGGNRKNGTETEARAGDAHPGASGKRSSSRDLEFVGHDKPVYD